ncbi:MAG: acetate/propionate family kinase [Kiloniellales bacterium]|nr:acetate/propionate family kinase [Kiloniellales bacterium]
MSETILVLNAGSSSIKFQLFAIGGGTPSRLFKGQIEGIGAKPRLTAKDAEGAALVETAFEPSEVANLPSALAILRDWLEERLAGNLPVAIGHRVVHGGPSFDQAVLIDDAVLAELEHFVSLAPLHQPNNLAPIKAIRELLPDILQVACFDTAFHRNHGELADRFALPGRFYDMGIRRYGFHGLSYEYIAGVLPEVAPQIARGRVIAAHLGSGASLCAIDRGRSVDSTMGFTALDGLPMGTRPGQLDPGVVLFLISHEGMSPQEVERLLYHDCGLKGLSGVSNDVRDLLASEEPGARLALDYFAFRVAKEVGALTSVLGGIDALIFTAGVGENAPEVRRDICERLAWLGISVDDEANRQNAAQISRKGTRPLVYVVPTDEERMIATHALRIVGAGVDA